MKKKPKASICVLILYSLILTTIPFTRPIQAQTSSLPTGVQKVTSVEGITEYRLANGLKVLLFPDAAKQTITVNITYLVGSKHENYGETGMAHLLEHLVFKGTPKYPNIPQEQTSRGARPNGTTSTDRTNYFESFAATEDNLAWALDLEADRMVNSFIAKKDLDSEFSVVRNEMESGENSPFRVLWQRVMGAAYEWHNYGKSTIGARSDVENVPIDRLQAFYKKYYQPDNAVLVVSGKFDEAKTIKLVNDKFGPIPKPTRELPKIYTVEPAQDGEKMVTVRRIGDTQMLMAGYHMPAGPHPDFAAVSVMSSVLSNEPSGPLYKALVESKKATSTFNLTLQFRDPSYAVYAAELPKDKSIEEAKAAMIETLEKFGSAPPLKEDVERAKLQFTRGFDSMMTNPEQVGLSLSEWIAKGDWRLMFLNRDRVAKVTPEDVQKAAQKYLRQTNRTVGMFIPADKSDRVETSKSSDDDIAAMVKDYRGNQAIAAGEAFEATPSNIEKRTQRATVGGVKLAMLPKENRGDTVYAAITLRFGDEKSLMGRVVAANFVGQMLTRGTAKRNRQQLQDELTRLKALFTISGGPTGALITVQTTRQNFAEAMTLFAEMLRESTFPADEFERIKEESITSRESSKREPSSMAIEAMNKHFNRYPKDHPLYSWGNDEYIAAIKALTVEDVRKFHKDFYGASTGEIGVVGDFDPAEVQSLVSKLYGEWKSPVKYTRIQTQYYDVPMTDVVLESPDKANAFFLARLNLKMRDDNPDYPSMLLGNFMFGGGFLNSRFLTRIRQKDGVSYGGGSGFSAGSIDEVGAFTSNAISAPENVEKVEKGFREELQKVLTEGFTEAEVKDAISGLNQLRQQQRAQDLGLAATLRNQLFINRTMAFEEELDKKIASLTAAQVNEAIKKFITPDKISLFKVGDFAKAKEKMNTSKP